MNEWMKEWMSHKHLCPTIFISDRSIMPAWKQKPSAHMTFSLHPMDSLSWCTPLFRRYRLFILKDAFVFASNHTAYNFTWLKEVWWKYKKISEIDFQYFFFTHWCKIRKNQMAVPKNMLHYGSEFWILWTCCAVGQTYCGPFHYYIFQVHTRQIKWGCIWIGPCLWHMS